MIPIEGISLDGQRSPHFTTATSVAASSKACPQPSASSTGGKRLPFWGGGAERISGRLRHEVTGRGCVSETLLHCDQPGCDFCNQDCPVACAMKTSQPVEAIGFLHPKTGAEIPVRIHAVPVHNQHGSVIGAVETFEEPKPAANVRDRDDGPQHKRGDDEDHKPAASE